MFEENNEKEVAVVSANQANTQRDRHLQPSAAGDYCCDLGQGGRTGSEVIPRLQDCIADSDTAGTNMEMDGYFQKKT